MDEEEEFDGALFADTTDIDADEDDAEEEPDDFGLEPEDEF